MEAYKIEIPVIKKRTTELTSTEKEWMEKAVATAQKAYAPYSNFQVGTVVVLEDGTFITGNNQENAAYPSGLCAERVALYFAGAQYPDTPVRAIVIVAMKNGIIQNYISPCGECRQVLLETEKRYNEPVRIILCGKDNIHFIESASALLPLSFDSQNL